MRAVYAQGSNAIPYRPILQWRQECHILYIHRWRSLLVLCSYLVFDEGIDKFTHMHPVNDIVFLFVGESVL